MSATQTALAAGDGWRAKSRAAISSMMKSAPTPKMPCCAARRVNSVCVEVDTTPNSSKDAGPTPKSGFCTKVFSSPRISTSRPVGFTS